MARLSSDGANSPPAGPPAIFAGIRQAVSLYHSLLLVVGSTGSGKTHDLRAVSASSGATFVNVGLDLAERLLDMPTRHRPMQVQGIFEELVTNATPASRVVLLDNIELLFDAELRQDPLRLLRGVSRDRTVVAAWPGAVRGGTLRYAAPPHREFREYPAHGLLTVAPGHGATP